MARQERGLLIGCNTPVATWFSNVANFLQCNPLKHYFTFKALPLSGGPTISVLCCADANKHFKRENPVS